MTRSANAITDGVGNLRLFMNGSLKISEIRGRKVSIWGKNIKYYESCRLGDLLSDVRFDMLVRHLVQKGFGFNCKIKFSHKEGVRSIIIKGKEYRANSQIISSKKFGDIK